ncbi:nucleotidyltransferase family protein [Colwelliaceae bacterium MEBiC 14330]
MFEALILAGGQGTRLKSVTGELPKPMVDVNGIPFLYRLMKRLEQQGCQRIVLSLCYRADYIIEQIRNDQPVSCAVDFAVEKQPLDTGGAIKYAAQYITTDKFVVLNGDTFSDLDYNELVQHAITSDLVICGVHVEDVSRYGTLDIAENNTIKSMNEKGSTGSGIINSGTYVISTNEIASVEKDIFSFERDYVKNYTGVFTAFISKGYFIDIGIPEDYHKICQQIK